MLREFKTPATEINPTQAPLRRQTGSRLILPSIILLAACLQLSLISGERLHPDEALYATWARYIATGDDVWLTQHIVDKPPLFIYTLAIPFSTIGASEELARLPNILASLCSIALLYGIAHTLYNERRSARLAACVFALLPYTLLFAPTAFTDPFMLCWILMAWWLTLKRRMFYAGITYGLALATKQDAILLLPLFLILDFGAPFLLDWLRLSSHCKRSEAIPPLVGARSPRPYSQTTLAMTPLPTMSDWFNQKRRAEIKNLTFIVGCAIPLALVVGWSLMRPQPNYWQASLDHYGGVSLASFGSYPERIGELFTLTRALSSEWLLLLAIIVAPLLLTRPRHAKAPLRCHADIGLWFFACYWRVTHLVLGLQVWDRYLLPLVPIAALLIARSVVFVWDRAQTYRRNHTIASLALIVTFALALALPARAVWQHELDLSGTYGLYDGIDELGLFFWRTDTTATILYMHDLSWSIDYYTFGRALDRRWVDSPIGLVADAGHMVLAKKFLVLATWEHWGQELTDALASVNLKAEPVFITYRRNGQASIIIYRLTPKAVGIPALQPDNSLLE